MYRILLTCLLFSSCTITITQSGQTDTHGITDDSDQLDIKPDVSPSTNLTIPAL